MKRLMLMAVILLCAGCTRTIKHENNVLLTGNNYKTIKSGAVGESSGFKFLGLIPIVSPSYADAKTDLYKNTGENLSGRPVALVNEVESRSSIYLILFSIPSVQVTADIVEFTGPAAKTQ